MDLTPTLEEYAQIIGWPIHQGDLIYTKTRVEVSYGHLTTLLQTHLPEKREGLHSAFLIKHLQMCLEERRWAPFMATTAVLIYGLILFPSRPRQVDEVALAIYLEVEEKHVNPVPAILAETFMQLSICRAHYGYSFRASATMLAIWISLHTHPRRGGTLELGNPLAFSEEIDEGMPQLTPEQCKTYYANLRSYDIKWKVLEGDTVSFIQSSADLMCVPLIGVRGFTAYSPCLVMRQFGCSQPLPMLRDMKEYTRSYTEGNSPDINKKVRWAWRNNEVHTIKSPFSIETDPEYPAWFQERMKDIVKGKMPTVEAPARSRLQLCNLEREIAALKGIIASKDATISDLNRKLLAYKNQSQDLAEAELEKARLERRLALAKQRCKETQSQIDDLQATLKNRPKGVGAELTQLGNEAWESRHRIKELEQQNNAYKRERETFLSIEMSMQEEIDQLKDQLGTANHKLMILSKSRKME